MKKGADGSKIAAPIWNEYMKKTLRALPREDFTKPAPLHIAKPILNGGIGDRESIMIDVATGLRATDQTPIDRQEARFYHTVHDTLFYVDKDNPQGLPPQHPEGDPQFASWERVVREWAVKNNIVEKQIIPDIITEQQSTPPVISIEYPSQNDTITDGMLSVRVSTSASHPISYVQYYLDDQLLDTLTVSPYTLQHTLSSKDNGFHALIAKITDSTGASQSASVTINILLNKQ